VEKSVSALGSDQYFPAFLSAASIVRSGGSRDNGASSSGTAPWAAYHPATLSFFASMTIARRRPRPRPLGNPCPPPAEVVRQCPALALPMYGQARQAEARHVMPCQHAPYDLWCPRIINRRGAQAVEPENRLVIGIVNRKESFRAAQLMAPARVTAHEFIQGHFAAIETLPDRASC
jgi:hypothetical protein